MNQDPPTYDDLNTRLSAYSLAHQGFSSYLSWIFQNVPVERRKEYDFYSVLAEGRTERLQKVEMFLKTSMQVLGMDIREYIKAFGFSDDLLVDDPEKIHDMLAEPLVAVTLSNLGFDKIKKLSKPIVEDGNILPTADFLASLKDLSFAVEVKTIRMEKNLEEGRTIGDGTIPIWWEEMMRSNMSMKIEDKKRKVFSQLKGTAKHYKLDKTLLVIYTRRLGPSTLLSETEAMEALESIGLDFPEIDYFCLKLFFGETYFFPRLPE